MSVAVRLATLFDVPRLMVIRGAVTQNRLLDPTCVTPDDYAWFVSQSLLFVAEEHGVVLAFSAGDPRDSSLWALFVDPLHQGRGLGRVLLQRACDSLKALGVSTATLTTEPGTRAEQLYRRDGWREEGLTAHGDVIFTKAL